MSYISIIPDGLIPTRECLNWLHNEAVRLQDALNEAYREYFDKPSLERFRIAREWSCHAKTLGLFNEVIHKAYYDASDRYSNQPAFDWMKRGDF